jgi:Ca-activated chloride channel family protein
VNPQIPVATENAILRALAKNPSQRQQQVLAFCEEIQRGAGVGPARILPDMVTQRAEASAARSAPVSEAAGQAGAAAVGRARVQRPRTGLLAGVAAVVIVAVAALVIAVVLRPWESGASQALSTTPPPSATAVTQPSQVTPNQGDGGGQSPTPAKATESPTTVAPEATPTAAPSNVHVLYILDAAEGMQTRLGSQTKLTASRIAIVDNLVHVQSGGPPINAGLLVFGHKIRDPRDEGNCDDANVEVQLPILAGSSAAIRDRLEALASEHGGAPLGNAIAQGFGEFRFVPERVNAVILIAGASSFCGVDPLTPITRNAEVGQKLPIYVVGLSVTGADEREVLVDVADATGGLYRDAASASELVRVLGEFVDLIRQQT